MTLTDALVSFALVAAVLTVTPGLDLALVLRAALRDGRRAAAATGMGVCAGILAWAVAAAVGVSALLAASATAFTVLKLVGAVYMVYLGLRMLWGVFRGNHAVDLDAVPSTRGGAVEHFRRGLLTNLLNPKIGAFYVALLPQFMADGVEPALMGLLLSSVHVAETSLFFGLVIVGAHAVRGLLQKPAAQRAVDGVTGTVLVAFGARLALSR
ncbi:LysE family translocator [Kytococcus sp. Marseille-QA3725]